jgi:hypothetical protein
MADTDLSGRYALSVEAAVTAVTANEPICLMLWMIRDLPIGITLRGGWVPIEGGTPATVAVLTPEN